MNGSNGTQHVSTSRKNETKKQECINYINYSKYCLSNLAYRWRRGTCASSFQYKTWKIV